VVEENNALRNRIESLERELADLRKLRKQSEMSAQTLSGRILSVATDHARALDLLPEGEALARANGGRR
jgi:cell shape-determining protein MreC